jgi:hypothetical protein
MKTLYERCSKTILFTDDVVARGGRLRSAASGEMGAIKQAQGTCVLPFGIIEKHGPQLPLGTDLITDAAMYV